MLKTLISLSLFGLLLGLSGTCWATESAWPVRKDALFLEIQPQWGSYSNDEPSAVQELKSTTRVEFGYIEKGVFAFEVPFRALARQASENLASGFSTQSTANAFTDLWIGHYYQIFEEPLSLTLRTGLSLPLGYALDTQPVLGEGQLNLDMAILAGYLLKPLPAYLQAGTGYRLRGNYSALHIRRQVALAAGKTLDKPSDQLEAFAEAGYWLHPALLLSLGIDGDFGLTQENALQQSSLYFRPRLAWRIQPDFDLSLQYDQPLWTQNLPFISSFRLGAHLRFGQAQDKTTGLRGGETEADFNTP
ncbi:hypothetical protein COW36_22680 [bacterium (Candidatus Blackallbacteria) CG17_big_fil_post_rev_8_21_14_2_50_48_46]|uniref:Transporter n=1 Tax=bacterium (Candidatus Blackallbacteria) CG17_big_fil_post_rev_8_21_14_2_50_48_46 TaxID=2014261 RepID=A0A2M7FXZ9_9BACT|nr:MAG: hypothetical protein COW64_07450 [bacterium (Candidatus Blackallbacteria) CG18_big_fil_WC_8_21_14_2_50_49_26]PIW14185.1 MAG: hypothetical protein COW36_22680 [bacterium (Candidatus Blackallbacteria) CG17_big_fil_post_rev_8_21_14_2_50_48_46]PIW46726.1 MAG: hypothetical protein COW20_14955 [bacterium (Candidatus Blackallbacteria) CG13_big_fil_rev_8_21_14_2_50_49_14]